jgi:hypothetical protein
MEPLKYVALVLLNTLSSGLFARTDIEHVLDATAYAETQNQALLGDRGHSISAYQIYDSTWGFISDIRKQNGERVYGWTSDATISRAYAKSYLEWLNSKYVELTMAEPKAETLYLMYTMGWTGSKRIGFVISKAPSVKRRGCARFLTHYVKR